MSMTIVMTVSTVIVGIRNGLIFFLVGIGVVRICVWRLRHIAIIVIIEIIIIRHFLRGQEIEIIQSDTYTIYNIQYTIYRIRITIDICNH